MFTVYHSNNVDVLQSLLVELIRQKPLDNPFIPEHILVQSPGMSQWLNIELAKAFGVAANIVFPLPATIPFIPNGEEDIDLRILPGIKANGISATRQPYPFYNDLELEMTYEAGRIDTISFETSYVSNAHVILAEDFESANRFEANSTSTADIVRTIDPDLVYEGSGSGYIQLQDSTSHVMSTTQEQLYNLPTTGTIWMEFDYSCDNSFAVGLEAIGGLNAQRTPIIVLNPTDGEWNKLYLDLGPMVWSTPDAYGYEITLDAVIDIDEPEGFVLVDNFKIVHYE